MKVAQADQTPRAFGRRAATALVPGSSERGERGHNSANAASRSRAPFVSVAIRVKPSFTDEPIAIWAKPASEGEVQRSRRVCCHRGYLLEEYEFSRVFGPEDDNSRLFHDLQGPALTASVFGGVNETLFAYGQTGSGKTHTIFGSHQEPGLLQLFVRCIFDQAEVCQGSTVHACCYEVLGDSLTDLIDSKAMIEAGILQEDDVVYDELFIKTQRCRYQIVRVSSRELCLRLLQDARLNRTSGVSSFNADSSRSHANVHLFVQNPSAAGAATNGAVSTSIGALTLVDLAGTEKEHENPSERGRKSARLLNTSLSSLNRLLRKLQTGSLDESERRQSVLNKCLWEYLRPGCGIALIFCASPLLQHRTTTLSTLSMATDSKLIHSHRKSQYIQIPGPQATSAQAPFSPAASPATSRSGAFTPYAWSANTPPPLPKGSGERTPRQHSRGATPTHSGVRGRGADFCMTPRMCRGEAVSPYQEPGQRQGPMQEPPHFQLNSVADLENFCGGYECPSPAAMGELAAENAKLRRKLQRARARSQDVIKRAEHERDQLASDNLALQRECESLRALFIRQQQQQIAFWTGPFMDMMNTGSLTRSNSAALAAAKAAASNAAEAMAAMRRGAGSGDQDALGEQGCAEVEESQETVAPAEDEGKYSGGGVQGCSLISTAASSPPSLPPAAVSARFLAVSSGTSSGSLSSDVRRRPETPEGVQIERDYWKDLATSLQRDMQIPAAGGKSHGASSRRWLQAEQGQQESELSSSLSQRGGISSERFCGHWSDSSSELGEGPTRRA